MSRSSLIFGFIAVLLGISVIVGRNYFLKTTTASSLSSSASQFWSSMNGSSSSKKKIKICSGMNVTRKKMTEHGEGPEQSAALLKAQQKAQEACNKVQPKSPCPKGCNVTHMGGPLPVGKPQFKGKKGSTTVTQVFVCTRTAMCSP